MSQGNDFASYTASAAAGATGSEDVWFVAVASDDIKQMSVDQLDEAFRLGIITAETAVWTEGMEAWAPLGEVADLDTDSDASDAADRESAGRDEQRAQAQGGREYAETSAHREYHAQAQHAGGFAAQAAMQSAAQQSSAFAASTPSGSGTFGSVTLQSAQHGFGAGPSSFAPVSSSYAPSASPSFLGQSTGPVALNVDEDMPPIRHGRRFRPERWLLVAAAVGAIGVTAFNNSDLFSSSVAQADTRGTAAPALAARPYEEGGGVSKGASLSDSKADSEDAPAPAKAAEPAVDAPMGTAAPKAAAAEEEEAEPVAKAAAVAPSKDSLKGSFSKAFTKKKAPAAKAAKTKPRKPASRAVSKSSSSKASSKKPGVPRAASAFDPLNGSLP